MRGWRRFRGEPLVTSRNVVFLVLVAVAVAISIGAILAFGTFLDRFGT